MAKFMVVDDSMFQRKNLGKFLKRMGADEVFEAENGKEALTMYKLFSPDLVFMDLVMPEMEGIDALEKLLEIDRNANVVVVSSLGYDEVVTKAMSLGAKRFLTKPVDFDAAAHVVETVLGAP